MKIKNARSIGIDELYERRKQAIILHKQGQKNNKIAEIVGAHRNVVGQWITAYKDGGMKALHLEQPGRPSGSGRRLTKIQEKEIVRSIIDHCPDQLKLDFALWTRSAVSMLIIQKYKIHLPVRTVGEYLKRWNFTPQKPQKRFYERNETAVKKWLNEDYPAIKIRSHKENAEIHWIDETGLRSDDHHGRGYSPKGYTPVCRVKGTSEKTNMVSTITNQGKVRFMFYKSSMNAKIFIKFLSRLIKSTDKKVFLMADNLRTHHCAPVIEWIKAHHKNIEIFYLPSYSPDLNPDEYLNCDMKRTIGEKPDARTKGTLAKNAIRVMQSIQKQPDRVMKYFKHESIAYAL